MEAKCRQCMQFSDYRLQCACCRLRADIANPLITSLCIVYLASGCCKQRSVWKSMREEVPLRRSSLLEQGPHVKGAPSGNSALRNHRYAQMAGEGINACLVCVWACGKGLHFLSFCLFIGSQATNSFNQ